MNAGTKSRPLLCSSFFLAGCLWLAGCAGLGGASNASAFRDPAMSMQGASDLIRAGQTTKAEVLAALGTATVVKFDSAYEVWVYRARSTRSAAGTSEFVILFTPSSIVKKTRIKPAYGATAE